MPYFYNNEVNILFIHIPKTGGTSLEKYFENKFEIKLNKESLYTVNPKDFYGGISYQHQLYKTIRMNKSIFRIDYENIQIITSVRNPYSRIISDLLFKGLIKEHYTQTQVRDVIKKYLSDAYDTKNDNHRIPQHFFLLDIGDKLLQNIKILKTENLNKEMAQLGFTDFNMFEQVTNSKNKNYFSYLNTESIELINNFYDKDFEYFNYKKISTENDIDLCRIIINEEILQSNTSIKNYLKKYLESIREHIGNDNNKSSEKNDFNEILASINNEIIDSYNDCYKTIVEELSTNYKNNF
jgi:hypothetical protein